MNPVHQAALDLQQFVLDAGWKFCFIGGIVVARWGVERMTRDADMTVLTRFVQDDECIAGLLGRFAARQANAAEFAARARVLLLRHENGVDLDVALGAFDFEALHRSRVLVDVGAGGEAVHVLRRGSDCA